MQRSPRPAKHPSPGEDECRRPCSRRALALRSTCPPPLSPHLSAPPPPHTHTQSIPLPKGKNLTLAPPAPKNWTALATSLKAVLEEAVQQNGEVLATFKNNTRVELGEEVEEWRTEHDGGPPGKVLWKLVPKGR